MNAEHSHKNARLLIVDDEQVIRDVLADFLSLENFQVETAKDGKQALELLSQHHYDLVLTDLKMPEVSGLELLAAIQQHMPHVVTVMMTGFGTVETAIDAMKKGAYDYVLKPFKVDEVQHVIRRALEKQKLEAENVRLREALSLFKVSEAISKSLSLEQVVETMVDSVVDELSADVVCVLLDDGFGSYKERARRCRNLSKGVGQGHELVAPILLERTRDVGTIHLNYQDCGALIQADTSITQPSSLLVAALYSRNRVIGFLVAMDYQVRARFDGGKRKLMHAIADRASAAIDNASLYLDLQATFHQTIRGLAHAIDKMDRYTAGHSARVAAYSQILAVKLGLPESDVEIVRQAALMHDIGKIGCVLNLNKPGRLSEDEYDTFKQHPQYGRDILQPIDFLHPLIPGVYFHHERWNGTGYPLGLKAQNIPLIARIISVADTYDAMTSDRAYRKALPHDVAVAEISQCSGSQFDPDIAQTFIDHIDETVRGGRPAGDLDSIVPPAPRTSMRPGRM